MSLARYQKLREFSKTAEPAGKARSKRGSSYVIQKHDASHLHYDFRLELDGVLLSWAIPKGPALDPHVKRLAVQTEDHPIEYGTFEGTIPEGEYGGGTVMVWDRGTWQAEGDARRAYRAGRLNFQLHGEKLKGGWHLVRTGRGRENKKNWLLFKASDDAARPGDSSFLEQQPNSALSGRTMAEITAGKAGKVARKSGAKRARAEVAPARTLAVATKLTKPTKRAKRASSAEPLASEIPGAERGPLPLAVEAALATLVSEPPSGDEFVHEIKFDGYRVLARIEQGQVRLLTRGGEDWTERMPTLAQTLQALQADSAIVDGEFVALDPQGVSDFQLLQNSFGGRASAPLAYYAFDLLYLNGFDLRSAPLLARKAALQRLCEQQPNGSEMLRYSEHVRGPGTEFLARAKGLGLEGIVSKRASSGYRAGRSQDWQKSKLSLRQEFVIVGYTEPRGSRAHFGALLLAVRRQKTLVYSGRVGTGFDARSLQDLQRRLIPLRVERTNLEHAPRGAEVRDVRWVKPKLVAEVAYSGMTEDGLLRHPTFKGLREDKRASEVVLEQAQQVASRRRGKRTESKPVNDKPSPSQAAPPPLSHPHKVLYPELGLTKQDLADYYELVQQHMLPHVVHRPLTLLRCPGGRQGKCFFQKHPGESLAEGLSRVTVNSSEGPSEYAVLEDARGLRALVQMGALEVHIWGALADESERPDRLVFDLDPDPELKFSEVVRGARAVRALLEEVGLKSWLKTTGGKGLHVTVPIASEHGWEEVKSFCQRVAQELARRAPERYVATMSKQKRHGKIFVDYLRNARGATFVAPYSPRAREGAGIAMPIAWDDLSGSLKPERFSVQSAAKYLATRSVDPFASLLKSRQKLPSAPWF